MRRRVVLVPFGAVVASADYSPTLGRFLTRDPIGIAGGDVNWYCYCGNDPVNFVDGLLRFVQGTFFGQRILK